PVGDDEAIAPGRHLFQRRSAVGRIINVFEAELAQKITDDAYHGAVVVDHEHRHFWIECHRSCSQARPALLQAQDAPTVPETADLARRGERPEIPTRGISYMGGLNGPLTAVPAATAP